MVVDEMGIERLDLLMHKLDFSLTNGKPLWRFKGEVES